MYSGVSTGYKMQKESKYKSVLSRKAQADSKTFFKSKEMYEAELLKRQVDLLSIQKKVHLLKKKVVIVFEGPDAAGKGGIIKRLTEKLDPRGVRVHSISKPDFVEEKQHYFQRFFERLPSPGTIAIFDRSWYGRVLVERVEKLIPEDSWERAYSEINAVEKMWADDGILVLKYFLDLTWGEQKIRFQERKKDPLKSWKLGPEDHRNRSQWISYYRAFVEMLERTHTKHSGWMTVASDSKWFARVEVLGHVLKKCRKEIEG